MSKASWNLIRYSRLYPDGLERRTDKSNCLNLSPYFSSTSNSNSGGWEHLRTRPSLSLQLECQELQDDLIFLQVTMRLRCSSSEQNALLERVVISSMDVCSATIKFAKRASSLGIRYLDQSVTEKKFQVEFQSISDSDGCFKFLEKLQVQAALTLSQQQNSPLVVQPILSLSQPEQPAVPATLNFTQFTPQATQSTPQCDQSMTASGSACSSPILLDIKCLERKPSICSACFYFHEEQASIDWSQYLNVSPCMGFEQSSLEIPPEITLNALFLIQKPLCRLLGYFWNLKGRI